MANENQLEAITLDFEQHWQRCLHSQDQEPNIRHYLTRTTPVDASALLVELICIDLEYRWQSTPFTHASRRKRLNDYVTGFPELGGIDQIDLEIVAEEYRVRHRWGDRPGHSEYLQPFSHRQQDIAAKLRSVDLQLRRESCDADITRGSSAENSSFVRRNERTGTLSTEPQPISSSLRFADYQLQQMIGAGHSGKVYRAWNVMNNTSCAVKYLRKQFLHDHRAVTRFIQEAELLQGFQHPNLVHVDGIGRSPSGGLFIVMELAAAGDLDSVIGHNAASRPPVETAITWVLAAASAIQHAHTRGVLHCDLKPGNILCRSDGTIAVTDFGLARSVLAVTESTTALGAVAGTAPYMAPEQVSAWWGGISPRTDVYGLGAVLYALLTGQPPVDDRTLTDTLAKVVSGTPIVEVHQLRADVPRELSSLCAKCLAKRPEDRFETMQQLYAELSRNLPTGRMSGT